MTKQQRIKVGRPVKTLRGRGSIEAYTNGVYRVRLVNGETKVLKREDIIRV